MNRNEEKEKGQGQSWNLPRYTTDTPESANGSTPLKSTPPSRTTILGVIVFLFISCVYLSLIKTHGFHPVPLTSLTSGAASSAKTTTNDVLDIKSEPSLAIPLHPEFHNNRPPITINLEWRISQGLRSPDGVEKPVYLINDDYPPTIEARTGDELVINVINELENGETAAIHWHGLNMEGFQEMDGAVGVTQCPIASGKSYEYRYRIPDQHGTFWYHAHDQEQRADGLFGGLVVHEPIVNASALPDYDEERLLLIGDWYNSRNGRELLEWYQSPKSFGMEPVPESLLVNFAGAYNCSLAARTRPVTCNDLAKDEIPPLEFELGKRYRLRIVNTGTLAGLTMSAPGMVLKAFEVDGGHGITSDAALSIGILYPGERVDVILEVLDINKATELEIQMDKSNFRWASTSSMHTHRFSITIKNNHTSSTTPPSSLQAYFDLSTSNASTTIQPPFPAKPDTTILLYITNLMLAHLDNIPHGFLNHTYWAPQSSPPLPLISLPRSQWDSHQFVVPIQSTAPNPKHVDLILNNQDTDSDHPFHLHGHSFHVLTSCSNGPNMGIYNPYEDVDPPCGPLNLVDPVERDTVVVPRSGYVVLRFLAGNEGIWFFHCHLLLHQASGMAMGIEVGEHAGGMEGAIWEGWGEGRRGKVSEGCGLET